MFVNIKNGNKVGNTDFAKSSVPDITESIDDFGYMIKYAIKIVVVNVTNTFILDLSHA